MKVVITRKIPETIKHMLDSACTTYMWAEELEPMPRHLLLEQAVDADAIFTNVSDRIDKELFQAAPRLKVVSTMAVGVDNIDLAEASRRGIPVGHTPGVLSEAVADLTFTLMLAAARKVVEGMAYIREGRWRGWGPMLFTGRDVYRATIGIIGMGSIGRGVARRAAGFDMRILYHNRKPDPEAEKQLGAEYCDLDTLLRQSDYVVMLAPATPETHRMIGARQFALMKPNAIFVNTSRGGNVDEQALVRALKGGTIWGAGLDVFEQEPIRPDHPLLALDNVVTLPHIGSATLDTRMNMAALAAQNILHVLNGEPPAHCANRAALGP
ncbi:2-hydroxyacid dehydrogenase [Paenibacillus piri]|uniref:D-glycerate dehydrogenase n=1 Tax=Paenibacillus piri TaxID=2547395 RepID=A0A4R5KE84_9BACL|nr:D-glycerate dehydrogenase [Paenibacillus piri]TDF92527.1 D-glycerate dehydrogenase [Paenibacillus piri]